MAFASKDSDPIQLPIPFSKASSLRLLNTSTPSPPLYYPVSILSGSTITRPSLNPHHFLQLALLTPKLTNISRYLWLAGLPRPARPLHRHLLLNRQLLITEDPNEHLVWLESRFFIKPLPSFLLDWDFWSEHICISNELHQSACGFLLSYAWLVAYPSDLRIAKELGLLPLHVDWSDWTEFMGSFLQQVDFETLHGVAARYQFGELRLTRLSAIYRFRNFLSLRHWVRGYMSSSTWYRAFFAQNFAWLLAVFAFVTVLLSAMQVGLATGLQANSAFQSTSYRFAVASIVAVLGSVVLILVVWVGLFVYHVSSTWKYYNVIRNKRLTSLNIGQLETS